MAGFTIRDCCHALQPSRLTGARVVKSGMALDRIEYDLNRAVIGLENVQTEG